MLESPVLLGEVIQASTNQFTAQCVRLHDPPPFGSFVRIARKNGLQLPEQDPFDSPSLPDGSIYGLVFEAATASLEPNRRPAAFGLDEEELAREQPQLDELLATDFRCLTVAHVSNGRLRAYLPDKPPRLHARVVECQDSEVCALTEQFDFLRTIVDARDCACCDELIAASLRHACRMRPGDQEFRVRAGKEIASLLREDYDRLMWVLRKLAPEGPASAQSH